MSVRTPTPAELGAISEELGLSLSDAEARSYLELIAGTLANFYDVVDAMPDNVPLVKYPRTPGYRPQRAENPYNAWYMKTTIEGARTGNLQGNFSTTGQKTALTLFSDVLHSDSRHAARRLQCA